MLFAVQFGKRCEALNTSHIKSTELMQTELTESYNTQAELKFQLTQQSQDIKVLSYLLVC
jgi:hypothetical protein